MNLLKNISNKNLRKLVLKFIYSLPFLSQQNPRKKLITFKALCNNIQTFLDAKAILPQAWYLPIRQSETIHRKPPISLEDDIEDARFNIAINYFQYGYEYSIPEVYLSCISKGKIISQDFIVLSPDDYIFLDSLFSDYSLFEESGILDRIIFPQLRYFTGCYCVLGMRWADNYYHWLFDILPRISLLENFEDLRDIPLILPKKLKDFQKESLKKLGITSERIIGFEQDYWQVEKLYFPSLLGMTGNPTPWAVSWLRARFLDEVFRDSSSTSHCIYITRRDASVRRVLNEDKIIELLTGRGFEVICPTELSFSEQVKTFSQARIIISPHGAGLSNIVFAPANAIVVEMFPQNNINGCYWALANICGHRYAFLTGSYENGDFYICLDRLKALLEKVTEDSNPHN